MAARVVLAMSGGVDSSVAAYLLREQGYEVIGLFMRTGVHGRDDGRADHKKGCCSAVDAGDARRVADRLDIPFYALDFEKDFGRIIDYFADEYLAGRTPNPCVVCNNWLKFGKLWSYGQQLEADYIATGHYAQRRPERRRDRTAPRRRPGQGPVLCPVRPAAVDPAASAVSDRRPSQGGSARRRPVGGAGRGRQAGQRRNLLRARRRPRRVDPRAPAAGRDGRAASWTRPARCWPSTTASSGSRSASARDWASPPASGATSCGSCPATTRWWSATGRSCWRRDCWLRA